MGADMVFIAAGMGGGTGTGAAPIIAEVAKECNALTVAIVSRPFAFEGKRRRAQADEGITALSSCVDTLITIPNQRLISMSSKETTMKEAFRLADEVLLQAVKGVSDLINFQGTVNVDFADVRTVMKSKGIALMGVGVATGEHRVVEAAQRAISNPLQDDATISGAESVLINITGGQELTLWEVNEASMLIQEEMNVEADVIWGWVVDEALGENVRVTVIATGLPPKDSVRAKAQPTVDVDPSMKSSSILSSAPNPGSVGGGSHTDRVAKVVVNHTLDFDLPSFHDEH
jgi:cell division protein FtsZ